MKTTRRIRITALVTLVAAVVGVVEAHGSAARRAAHSSVGTVVATIPIPADSGALAVGVGAVWATSDAGTAPILTRIDPVTNTVVARVPIPLKNLCTDLPGSCGEAATGNGALWIARVFDNTVLRIDPGNNSLAATIRVGSQPEGIATTPGAVWVVNKRGPSVSRIDPATNTVVATIRIGPALACCSDHMSLAVGGGAVWVSLPSTNTIVRINPGTNKVVARVHLSQTPCAFLAVGERTVWAARGSCGGSVLRVNGRTNRPAGTVKGLTAPIGVAVGFGSVWVADVAASQIVRINPSTNRILGRLQLSGQPVRLAVGFGSLWVRDDSGQVLRVNPAAVS
jgi:YVTN family beta-propeller protein